MKTFFTVREKSDIEVREVEALDIITSEYNIAIRASGILIKRKNDNGIWEEADDITIELGD
jgi:hypothetical protein